MSEYIKYQHVERLGSPQTDGILNGTCYVFPKIDGTNAQVWFDERVRYGSRKRELSIVSDNAGFMAWAMKCEELSILCIQNKEYRFFGEWLVPHTLKDYTYAAWRRFYIFDAVDVNGKHVRYEKLHDMCMEAGYDDIIPVLYCDTDPTSEVLLEQVDKNNFLMKEGKIGEGIVIKNYDYVNKFGMQVWAKIVSSDFINNKSVQKVKRNRVDGSDIELEIVNKYLMVDIIDKIIAKLELDETPKSIFITKLLSCVWYDFVTECMYSAIHRFKNPVIDFKLLRSFVTKRVRHLKPELFGL